MSNQTKYDTFRQTFPEFVYEKYGYDVQPDGLHIVFRFRIGDICFQPTAFIPARRFLHFEQPMAILDKLVFNIGMIELVSYWKCYCPPIVRVECGTLDDSQVAFWKKIYFNGLGEFFYTNGIAATMEEFMTMENGEWRMENVHTPVFDHPSKEGTRAERIENGELRFENYPGAEKIENGEWRMGNVHTPVFDHPSKEGTGAAANSQFSILNSQFKNDSQFSTLRKASEEGKSQDLHYSEPKQCFEEILNSQFKYLLPIGGGKDSVVTLELLSELGRERIIPLIMNPRGATVGCIEAANYTMDDVLVIHRTIDPLLLQLNSQGCLNGHTPFSAMLAFYTLLAAQLSGHCRIALSNENSANESTVVGTSVNHQYSKSLEFENDFRRYVAEHISPDYGYFSFLRPLSELQIAMLFSRFEKYYDIFRSCNAGSKQDVWCGKCAKCLFAYIILSPFIPPERLNGIFGKSMLDDMELKPYFDQLLGHAETKPFECVGTIGEVQAALSMTLRRWYGDSRPALLKDYRSVPLSDAMLRTLSTEHNLNDQELALLRRHVQARAI